MPQPPLDPEDRARRREEADAHLQQRRRVAAVAALAAVFAIAVAVVALGGGSDDGDGQGADAATTAADSPAKAKAKTTPAGARAAEPAPGDSAPPDGPIPILMYHVVEAPQPGVAFPDLWLPAERFEAQVAMLKTEGYNAITMRDAWEYWQGKRRIPKRPIVLTFDDGYRSDVTVAKPALRKAGWPGVLYLTTAQLKTPGAEGITRTGVRELVAAGWELGGHTMEHPNLPGLPPERLRYEITDSKKLFEKTFKVKVGSFCYPAGEYDDATIAEVKRAGYDTATTVEEGLAEPGDPLLLKRIRVNGSDTAESLRQKLSAAGA